MDDAPLSSIKKYLADAVTEIISEPKLFKRLVHALNPTPVIEEGVDLYQEFEEEIWHILEQKAEEEKVADIFELLHSSRIYSMKELYINLLCTVVKQLLDELVEGQYED